MGIYLTRVHMIGCRLKALQIIFVNLPDNHKKEHHEVYSTFYYVAGRLEI